jgi:hypothetical protein
LKRQKSGRDGPEEPAARYRLEVTSAAATVKKKSGVLSLMFVDDADIEDIDPKLLKDRL